MADVAADLALLPATTHTNGGDAELAAGASASATATAAAAAAAVVGGGAEDGATTLQPAAVVGVPGPAVAVASGSSPALIAGISTAGGGGGGGGGSSIRASPPLSSPPRGGSMFVSSMGSDAFPLTNGSTHGGEAGATAGALPATALAAPPSAPATGVGADAQLRPATAAAGMMSAPLASTAGGGAASAAFPVPPNTAAGTSAAASASLPASKKDDLAEKSPQGYYVKMPELVGKGSFKVVYKAQDVVHGTQVAWNEISIKNVAGKQLMRILNEMQLLKTMSHPNLIAMYGAWINKDAGKVVFITELMTSGTLREFCAKYPISLRQIKRYCRDLLDCINYLHTPGAVAGETATPMPTAHGTTTSSFNMPMASPQAPAPPAMTSPSSSSSLKPCVIHRDLKCDNIFIQGSKIKVGDLGLATTDGKTVLGTPEFMAPEMFQAGYGSSVDIYSFGMCVLEMITGKSPFCEYKAIGEICRRVMNYGVPENMRALEVAWPEAHAFIMRCLTPKAIIIPKDPAAGSGAGGADSEHSQGAMDSPERDDMSSSTSATGAGTVTSAATDDAAHHATAGEDTFATVSAGGRPLTAPSRKALPTPGASLASRLPHVADTLPVTSAPAAAVSPHTDAAASSGGSGSVGQAASSSAGLTAHASRASSVTAMQLPPQIVLRPTAAELLNDAFLVVTEEDQVRGTKDIKAAAMAKGFPIISGYDDDEHRRKDVPLPFVGEIKRYSMPPWAAAEAMLTNSIPSCAVQLPSIFPGTGAPVFASTASLSTAATQPGTVALPMISNAATGTPVLGGVIGAAAAAPLPTPQPAVAGAPSSAPASTQAAATPPLATGTASVAVPAATGGTGGAQPAGGALSAARPAATQPSVGGVPGAAANLAAAMAAGVITPAVPPLVSATATPLASDATPSTGGGGGRESERSNGRPPTVAGGQHAYASSRATEDVTAAGSGPAYAADYSGAPSSSAGSGATPQMADALNGATPSIGANVQAASSNGVGGGGGSSSGGGATGAPAPTGASATVSATGLPPPVGMPLISVQGVGVTPPTTKTPLLSTGTPKLMHAGQTPAQPLASALRTPLPSVPQQSRRAGRNSNNRSGMDMSASSTPVVNFRTANEPPQGSGGGAHTEASNAAAIGQLQSVCTSLHEEVRNLRHHLNSMHHMLEFLVSRAEGGRAWMEQRVERGKAHASSSHQAAPSASGGHASRSSNAQRAPGQGHVSMSSSRPHTSTGGAGNAAASRSGMQTGSDASCTEGGGGVTPLRMSALGAGSKRGSVDLGSMGVSHRSYAGGASGMGDASSKGGSPLPSGSETGTGGRHAVPSPSSHHHASQPAGSSSAAASELSGSEDVLSARGARVGATPGVGIGMLSNRPRTSVGLSMPPPAHVDVPTPGGLTSVPHVRAHRPSPSHQSHARGLGGYSSEGEEDDSDTLHAPADGAHVSLARTAPRIARKKTTPSPAAAAAAAGGMLSPTLLMARPETPDNRAGPVAHVMPPPLVAMPVESVSPLDTGRPRMLEVPTSRQSGADMSSASTTLQPQHTEPDAAPPAALVANAPTSVVEPVAALARASSIPSASSAATAAVAAVVSGSPVKNSASDLDSGGSMPVSVTPESEHTAVSVVGSLPSGGATVGGGARHARAGSVFSINSTGTAVAHNGASSSPWGTTVGVASLAGGSMTSPATGALDTARPALEAVLADLEGDRWEPPCETIAVTLAAQTRDGLQREIVQRPAHPDLQAACVRLRVDAREKLRRSVKMLSKRLWDMKNKLQDEMAGFQAAGVEEDARHRREMEHITNERTHVKAEWARAGGLSPDGTPTLPERKFELLRQREEELARLASEEAASHSARVAQLQLTVDTRIKFYDMKERETRDTFAAEYDAWDAKVAADVQRVKAHWMETHAACNQDSATETEGEPSGGGTISPRAALTIVGMEAPPPPQLVVSADVPLPPAGAASTVTQAEAAQPPQSVPRTPFDPPAESKAYTAAAPRLHKSPTAAAILVGRDAPPLVSGGGGGGSGLDLNAMQMAMANNLSLNSREGRTLADLFASSSRGSAGLGGHDASELSLLHHGHTVHGTHMSGRSASASAARPPIPIFPSAAGHAPPTHPLSHGPAHTAAPSSTPITSVAGFAPVAVPPPAPPSPKKSSWDPFSNEPLSATGTQQPPPGATSLPLQTHA